MAMVDRVESTKWSGMMMWYALEEDEATMAVWAYWNVKVDELMKLFVFRNLRG